MRAFAVVLISALSLTLGACGFTPLYAERTGVSQDLSNFRVRTGEGRGAYLLRQQLIDRLGARSDANASDAEYELQVAIREATAGLGVRPDDVYTRYDLEMTARYVVRRVADGAVVHRGVVTGSSSYDAPGGPYSDIVVEARARERAAALVADRIRLELSIHLANSSDN